MPIDLDAIRDRDGRARVVNDIGSPITCAQDRRDLLAEVDRLMAFERRVQAVYDLQAPLQPANHYVGGGAYAAHSWWLRLLGRILDGPE